MAEKSVKRQRRYLSYLLRVWQESGVDPPHLSAPRRPPLWRASLERPEGGERLGFASLVDLFAFLESETRSNMPGLERRGKGGRQPPAIPE
jgi:hypothetical protein